MRLGFLTWTSRISTGGLTPMGGTNAAEATPGLSLTRRFTSEPSSVRIRPLSLSKWQQSASGSMENGMLRSWTLSSASGTPQFAAKECADLVERFIGFEIDEEYLKIAAELVECSYSRV